MTRPFATTGGQVAFLAELHGFFEACGEDVDAALAAHFGFDTAIDWVITGLELFTGAVNTPAVPRELTEGSP